MRRRLGAPLIKSRKVPKPQTSLPERHLPLAALKQQQKGRSPTVRKGVAHASSQPLEEALELTKAGGSPTVRKGAHAQSQPLGRALKLIKTGGSRSRKFQRWYGRKGFAGSETELEGLIG
jgi:hypothetical protein